PATVRIPTIDSLACEPQAPHSVRARGELHAPWRHLEDVRAAGCVEDVRPLKEARERLAILAVAEDAESGGGRNSARDAAHVAAPAAKREVQGQRCHVNAGETSTPARRPRRPRGCAPTPRAPPIGGRILAARPSPSSPSISSTTCTITTCDAKA